MEEKQTILIDPEEARNYLGGIGRNRIYDLLKRKDFPAFRLGNKYFINRELLHEWAKNQCKFK